MLQIRKKPVILYVATFYATIHCRGRVVTFAATKRRVLVLPSAWVRQIDRVPHFDEVLSIQKNIKLCIKVTVKNVLNTEFISKQPIPVSYRVRRDPVLLAILLGSVAT